MTLRPFIFWPHLVSGLLAGSIVFIMSVTGVLLTYEKQMIAWADRDARVSAPPGTSRLPAAELMGRIAADHEGARPSSVAMAAAIDAPLLAVVRQTTWLVDPYSGATIGESAPQLRRFFRSVTDWHRWLATSPTNRPAARAVTGWANFIFLLMVVSGLYLWWPRRWAAQNVRAVTLFNSRLSGKARDFNWHNVIGFWCAVPLFFVVISVASDLVPVGKRAGVSNGWRDTAADGRLPSWRGPFGRRTATSAERLTGDRPRRIECRLGPRRAAR